MEECFVEIADSPLSASVSIASWCPTMDLCAVVTDDAQLHLHRLNWQLLWVTSPQLTIQSVCWRPDGKLLSAGHSDGSVTLYDVESGEAKTRVRNHTSPIACISWVECPWSGSTYPRWCKFFHPLPTETPTPATAAQISPYHLGPGLKAPSDWPDTYPMLTMLVTCDGTGRTSVSAYGEVQVAECQLTTIEEHQSHPLQVALDSDMQHLTLLQAAGGSAGALQCAVYSTRVLMDYQTTLREFSVLAAHITRQLRGAQKCLELCAREWRQARQDFDQRMSRQLLQCMEDEGDMAPDPQAQFLCLLAAGTLSPAMTSFLSSNLGEAGLRRLAKTIDGALHLIHTILLEQLLPLTETTTFMIGELTGLARCHERLPRLGVQADDMAQLQREGSKLLVRLEQVRVAVIRHGQLYRSFFTWLLKKIRTLEGEEAAGHEGQGQAQSPPVSVPHLIEFLSGSFQKDLLAPELEVAIADELAVIMNDHHFPAGTGPGVCSLDDYQQYLTTMYGEAGTWPPRHLARQLKDIQDLAGLVFAKPRQFISPAIQLIRLVNLTPTLRGNSPALGAPEGPKRSWLAAIGGGQLDNPKQPDGPGPHPPMLLACQAVGEQIQDCEAVVVLQLPSSRGSEAPMRGLALILPRGWCLVDLGTYKDDQLVLLMATKPLGEGHRASATGLTTSREAPKLSLIRYQDAPWGDFSMEQVQVAGSLMEACMAVGAVVSVEDLPSRSRELKYSGVCSPLAVSGKRGVACVLGSVHRVLVMDLEEDQTEEEEGEEEVVDEQEGEDGGVGG